MIICKSVASFSRVPFCTAYGNHLRLPDHCSYRYRGYFTGDCSERRCLQLLTEEEDLAYLADGSVPLDTDKVGDFISDAEHALHFWKKSSE